MFCARLFICALWSPAGKGLTSWLSFVVSSVSLSLSHWYPGSGVVLDCIDSWSLHHYLLLKMIGSDIWDCLEKHFEQLALLCFEERSNLRCCLATVSICQMCGSFRMPGNVWWVMLSDERMAQWTRCKSFPFPTMPDGKWAWKWHLFFFFFADGDVAIFQHV